MKDSKLPSRPPGVIDKYPAQGSHPGVRVDVLAQCSFELAEYPQAEHAYTQVLAARAGRRVARRSRRQPAGLGFTNRVTRKRRKGLSRGGRPLPQDSHAAPTSSIRATAEYDARAAQPSGADAPPQ